MITNNCDNIGQERVHTLLTYRICYYVIIIITIIIIIINAVNGRLSNTFPLAQEVPQGSLLGPLLFTEYTSELLEIVRRHLPSVTSYADDTQLYLAFSPNVQGDDASAVKAMCDCIMDLRK